MGAVGGCGRRSAEKIGRIAVRVGVVEKARLMKAAQLQGVSLTDFVLLASGQMAEFVLRQLGKSRDVSVHVLTVMPHENLPLSMETPGRVQGEGRDGDGVSVRNCNPSPPQPSP